MWIRRGMMLGAALCICLAGTKSAWATIDNLKSFKLAYPGKDPKAYSCKVCHENAIGKSDDLNTYGKALKQFKQEGGAKKLTEEDYRAFDAADLDGDGVSNADELNAGTDPTDAASVPKADAPEKPASQAPTPENIEYAALYEWLMPDASAATDTKSSKATDEQAAPPAKAEYVGTETCAMCHAKQNEEFQQSTHARIAIPGEDVKAQGCEMCHGPGSLHVEAGGGRGVGGIINPRKDPSTCFECHLDKKAEFRLPYHHPLLEGKMSCADCHNAHGEDVRPWSATSLEGVNEACFKCHKEQRGPFVYEHEALREGCASCHKVHGSIHEKMLLVRDSNLCLRCHSQTNFPTIGDSSHASRFLEGTCFSGGCHTAPHGSNFDDHLRY